MNNLKVILIFLVISSQVTVLSVLIRNIIIRKSIIGWIYPEGSTKTEKVIFAGALLLLIILMILGPILFNE